MKSRFLTILCACCVFFAGTLVPAIANVATSPNYAFTYLSIDAGGEPSAAGDYAHDCVLTMVGGSLAAGPYAGAIGYAGQLNNPPIAQPDLVTRETNRVARIDLSYILANDFDPDGNSLTLFAADTRTSAGGSVGFFPDSLQYTPPAAYDGLDTFRYTIADDFNDTAEAQITVVIADLPLEQPMNSLLLYFLNDGKVLLRTQPADGFRSFTFQATDSLVNPNWTTLPTTSGGGDGNVFAIDDLAPGSPSRFYRAIFR